MAAKKKGETEDRNDPRPVRFLDSEWAEIEAAAKYSGLKAGTFVRSEMLKVARRVNAKAGDK